jgi:NADPH:quinone reductase-like Zn-dependent oxidoreductase
MTNPNIVFTAPNVAEVIDKPMPAPGPGQILVRTARTCISSGTERANLVGDPMVGIDVKDGAPAVFPRQAGYSATGIVVSVGEGVSSVKPGDRVAASWTKHAAFNALPESRVYRLPDGLSLEEAAWTHIATFPMAALRKCRLEFGEGVLVMGQGVLGQLAVRLARVAGATPVIAADPVDAGTGRRLRLRPRRPRLRAARQGRHGRRRARRRRGDGRGPRPRQRP